MAQKIILGIAGEIASGKDTVGKYLMERHGALSLRFSQPLRDILDRLRLEQNRENMAKISLYLRKAFGEDVLSKVIIEDAKESEKDFVVVDGVRRLPDILHMESDEHFYFAYIEADPEKRYQRLTQRRQNADDATKTAVQFEKDAKLETELQIRDLKERAEFVIHNDGTLEELQAQVDDIVATLRETGGRVIRKWMHRMKRKGRLIVIDGADGSGKATQAKLLVNRLRKEGRKVKSLDFPQYEKNFFGSLIGRALTGAYGDFIALDPHIASVLYAADRFESKKMIEKWLAEGRTVVLDRYASANQIHQGGKIADSKERKKFIEWLEKMEFRVFGLPRPDIILYLDVPQEISDRLLGEKLSLSKKKYSKGKKDLAESNAKHQSDARASALKMIQKNNRWVKISCAEKGVILPRGVIADRIWLEVNQFVK